MLVQVHSPSCFFQIPEDLNATRNGDWEEPAGLKLSVLKQSKSNGMDLHHCHSLEVPLLHRFSGRWDLWSAACLVGLEVLLVPALDLEDLAVHQLDHGTPYLTLRQIAWPCLLPWKMNKLMSFQKFRSQFYLDLGRGGITGLLGDLSGLKEGFMVAFVASERKKMEKFELAVTGITCASSSRRGSLRRRSEREFVLEPFWERYQWLLANPNLIIFSKLNKT